MKHTASRSFDPLPCPAYTVSVDGCPVTVHGAKSCKPPFPFKCFKAGTHPGIKLARPDAWGGPAQIAEAGNAPYAFACFPAEGSVEVEIASPLPLQNVRVRPAGAAVVTRVDGNRLTLTLAGPTKLSIEPDGRHGGLLLFADEPERDIPDPDDPKVHFYGPGLHRAGVIRVSDGETLYLAPGAVVEGGVCVENAANVRITGRGILCGDPWGWRAGPQKDMMMFTESEHILVEGITLRCSWQWTFRMTGCRNITIRNLKLCQGKNLNDDGIDPSSTSDVLIEECFIRTHDDNISIKAHCDDRRPSERIEIRRCLHWSDLSRILMVGPESHADRIGDIHMHNCEVIYLGPPIKKTGFGDWDGCAPFVCIEAGEDCRMEKITVENITVHVEADRDGKDVILIEPTVNAFMKRQTLGDIRDICFRNIAFVGEPCTPTIRLWGKDAAHTVEGVHFEQVTFFGQSLTAAYPGLTVGQHTAGISFSCATEDNGAHEKTRLGAAAELDRFAESRKNLAADPYRPIYHFVSPERTLNDPNGLCFWRGKWHLFYQAQPAGDDRQHWGHAVSDDLIHWRDLPYAIRPGPEERCFSGTILTEPARAIAVYHGVGAGTMAAVASDPLLLDWTKIGGQPVIPCPVMWETDLGPSQLPGWKGNPPPKDALNLVYDPCVWKQGERYYALTGGALPHRPSGRRMRTPFLFRSNDLAHWEYLHPFVEGDIFGLPGDDFGCPYFQPLGDRHILLHFSHMSGAHYLIGDYDTARDKFVAAQGGDFTFGAWYPGGVHAPSASPDGRGGVIAIFNVNAAKPTHGWDQIMSLPRRLTLIGRDELGQEPAGDIASLREAHRRVAGLALPANIEIVLDGVAGNVLELDVEIETQAAQMVELNVLRSPGREEFTRIAFYRQRGLVDWRRSDGWARHWESRGSLITLDTSYSSGLPDAVSRAPETAPVFLSPGEPLHLRVFIDRSIVEVFVNGRQCVAARVYPGRSDSLGVSLRAQGADATLRALDAWTMKGIE